MEDLPVMPFEMKNLTSFPMEQLCFDLKLEALEQIDAKDVVELTKVNQGFQGMLVKDPSIVFGRHVSRIRLFTERIKSWKFSNSDPIRLNVNPAFSHFSFVKRIRSCGHLWLGSNSIEAQERFFSNFHASIMKEAFLAIDGSPLNDQVIKDRMENFMLAAQLKDCEMISFDCCTEDSVRFFYNALSKSEFKNVYIRTFHGKPANRSCMKLLIQQIITNGIPSKNPEAAIYLDAYNFCFPMDLSQYAGMRRIDEENRLRLLKQGNYLARSFGWTCSVGSEVFREDSMFRRRFDSTKDCIFVYREPYTGFFCAFAPSVKMIKITPS